MNVINSLFVSDSSVRKVTIGQVTAERTVELLLRNNQQLLISEESDDFTVDVECIYTRNHDFESIGASIQIASLNRTVTNLECELPNFTDAKQTDSLTLKVKVTQQALNGSTYAFTSANYIDLDFVPLPKIHQI